MKTIIQRVHSATVAVDNELIGQIGHGLMVLAGWAPDDTESEHDWMASKLLNMRIFPDESGQMNRSLLDIGGEILVVSQFTLFASTKKGNRPGYSLAASPSDALRLYDHFCLTLHKMLPNRVQTGRFGADMLIRLENYGPVTIIVDTQNKI
jgi:D-tyrosyl-tRNA(Tyr) deacylase